MKIENCVGIDVACKTFIASIYHTQKKKTVTSNPFENNIEGFKKFVKWLHEQGCSIENTILCMEDTGNYSKRIAYFLVSHEFKTCVEQALKVKRAFSSNGHKTDASDSKQIAEYAFRYLDKLSFFKPLDDVLEKIKQLLTTRDLLVKQKTALKNAHTSYQFNVVHVELIHQTFDVGVDNLEKQIERIDKELDDVVNSDPHIKNKVHKMHSITGFGKLLSMYTLVLMNNEENLNYKKLAAYIGICPYKHQSGTSVHKRDKIRQYGSNKMKGLLRLAAMSVATHDPKYRAYYLRKQQEGKLKAVALNNIANKLLKVCCAVLRDNNSYFIKEHYSVNPMYIYS